MPLTDPTIRNAKYGAQPNRLFDERGLYLELSPSGGKWWRFKYRYEEKKNAYLWALIPMSNLKTRESFVMRRVNS